MMKPSVRIKVASIVLCLISLGTIITPRIIATNPQDLVDYKIDVCGTSEKWSPSVTITTEEAKKIDNAINTFLSRLNFVSDQREALELYYNFIEELDHFHLLGRLSVNQTYHLVTASFRNYPLKNNNFNPNSYERINLFCLLTGMTDHTIFVGPIGSVYLLFNGGNGFDLVPFFSYFISSCLPFQVLSTIYLGNDRDPADGTVWSLGELGIKIWIGSFLGKLKYPRLWIEFLLESIVWYPGVVGFSGIKIMSKDWSKTFYFGSAIYVKIGYF